MPLAPLSTLNGEPAPAETTLELPGYAGSAPVRLGNGAGGQLQLDAYGNVLIAAKLLYGELGTLEHGDLAHWDLIAEVADFLADNWREPDHGLWEEETPRHYPVGKVVAACGLEFIADYSEDAAQARRWRGAAQAIRRFVAENCLTPEGAYAAVAGGMGPVTLVCLEQELRTLAGRPGAVLAAATDADAAGERLAARLAGRLRAGDLLVLTGGLGAGKTTFTQGLGEALGVAGPVTSPTFVIAHHHRNQHPEHDPEIA